MAGLLNVSGDGVGDKFVDDLLKVCGADLPGDDVDHLLPDVLHLGALSIAGLLGRLVLLAGEPNAEQPQHVTVSGLDVNIALHKGLPLLDHGPQLVCSEVHPVEAGQAVLGLDILTDELELPVRPLGVILVLEISKRNLEDATLQTLGGDLGTSSSGKGQITNTAQIVIETSSPVHQGLSNLSDLEDGWGLDVIPGNIKVVKEVISSGTVLFTHQSFLVKGSTIFFLTPFLPPILRPLFLPTAIFYTSVRGTILRLSQQIDQR